MSIRSDFIIDLEYAQANYIKAKKQIIDTMNSDMYTVNAKRQKVDEIIARQKGIADDRKEKVRKAVESKVHFLDAEEKDKLQRRYSVSSAGTTPSNSSKKIQ